MNVPDPSNVEGSNKWYIWGLGEKRKPEDFISKPKMEIALVKKLLERNNPIKAHDKRKGGANVCS